MKSKITAALILSLLSSAMPACSSENNGSSGDGNTEGLACDGRTRSGGTASGDAAGEPTPLDPGVLQGCLGYCNTRQEGCPELVGCESDCSARLEETPGACADLAAAFFECLRESPVECPAIRNDCDLAEEALDDCEDLNNPYGCGAGNSSDYASSNVSSEGGTTSTCGLVTSCDGVSYAIDCVQRGGSVTCECSVGGEVVGTCDNGDTLSCRGVLDGCCQQEIFCL